MIEIDTTFDVHMHFGFGKRAEIEGGKTPNSPEGMTGSKLFAPKP
jgi:hypothetical protein